jgi:hypothetical protein
MRTRLSDAEKQMIRTFVKNRLAFYPPDQRGFMRYALARSGIVILRSRQG